MIIISLIGPRAVGKSVVGKDLAKRLDYNFIEIDEYMMDYLKDYGGIAGFAKKKGKELGDSSEGWREYYKKLKEFISNVLIPEIEEKGESVILDCGGGTTYREFEESDQIAKLLKSKSTFVLIEGDDTDEESIDKLFSREVERRDAAIKEGKEYPIWKDHSDSQLYERVREDYNNRIKGFREQAVGTTPPPAGTR